MSSRRKIAGWLSLAALLGVLWAALGDSKSSASRPFSYSVNETRGQCSGGSLLPQAEAETLLEQPPPKDWRVVQGYPGAVFANGEVVELHLRPGSERRLTLKRIDFHVQRLHRPRGLILYPHCSTRVGGWQLSIDFDSRPPRVGIVNIRSESQVHFPWTLSVSRPMTVYVVGRSGRCYCRWTADIPWASGSKKGTIVLGEEKPFQIAYSGGLWEWIRRSGRWVKP